MLAIPSVQLGVVRLWNLATNRDVAVLRFPAPRLVAFAGDQKKLVAFSQDGLRAWNLEGAGDKRVLSPHPGGVPAVAFSPNGKLLAAGGKDRSVSLWNPATGQCLRRIANLPLPVQTLAFSPDGNWLALSFGAGGRIVSTSDEHQHADLPQPLRGHVISIAFSPDGRHVAISSSGGVSLWKTASESDPLHLSPGGLPSDVQGANFAFSPDGRHLAWIEVVGVERTLRIWDMKESKGRTLTGARPTHWIWALDFPRGGRVTFVNQKNEAETWDIVTGKRDSTFGGAEMEKRSGIAPWCAVSSLSRDGAWYAVANRAVSVWDAHTGRMLLALPPETSPVLSLAWSPNREYLAVGSADGGLAVWHIPTVRDQLNSLGLDW